MILHVTLILDRSSFSKRLELAHSRDDLRAKIFESFGVGIDVAPLRGEDALCSMVIECG